MGELSQGVVLIHELAQRRGAEELLDDGRDRPDVDEALGGDGVEILHGHALADDPLQAGEAHAELVLQELTHAAKAAVTQVVNVVGGAGAVHHAAQVVDGGQDVVLGDVLGDEILGVLLDGVRPVLGVGAAVLLEELLEGGEADLFLDAVLLGVKVHELRHVHHAVGEDLHGLAVHGGDDGLVDAAAGDLLGLLAVQGLAVHGDDLAGEGIGHGRGQGLASQAGPDVHLLVELIPADLGDVVAPGVEEEGVQVAFGALHRGGLAGTKAAVDLEKALFPGLAGVLLEGGENALVLAEELLDLPVGLHAKGADEAGDGNLAVFIDADVEDVHGVGLILQPGAAVGNDGGGVGVLVGLVHLVAVVHAGAADDLRDNDALCAIDDEGAAVGHQREISHEDLLLLDLVGLLVVQAHPHLDGLGIGGVALLALLHGVLGRLVHAVVEEAQLQVSGVVGDGVDVLEDLVESLSQETLIGILLNLQEVGDLENSVVIMLGIALAKGLAVHDVLNHCHVRSSQPFLWNSRSWHTRRCCRKVQNCILQSPLRHDKLTMETSGSTMHLGMVDCYYIICVFSRQLDIGENMHHFCVLHKDGFCFLCNKENAARAGGGLPPHRMRRRQKFLLTAGEKCDILSQK